MQIELYIFMTILSFIFFFISAYDSRLRVYFGILAAVLFFVMAFASGAIERADCEVVTTATTAVSGGVGANYTLNTTYTNANFCAIGTTNSGEMMMIDFMFAILSVIFFMTGAFDMWRSRDR